MEIFKDMGDMEWHKYGSLALLAGGLCSVLTNRKRCFFARMLHTLSGLVVLAGTGVCIYSGHKITKCNPAGEKKAEVPSCDCTQEKETKEECDKNAEEPSCDNTAEQEAKEEIKLNTEGPTGIGEEVNTGEEETKTHTEV